MGSESKISLAGFAEKIGSISAQSFENDFERKQAVIEAQSLLARLQTPQEKTTQIIYIHVYLATVIKCLVNLQFFEKWEKHGGKPATVEELGSISGAEPTLLARLLRLLVACKILDRDPTDRYLFGEFAAAITQQGLGHSYTLHSFTTANSVVGLPKYLIAHDYRNPTDSAQSPWAWHMGEKFMDYLLARPEVLTHINLIMKHKNIGAVPWFTFYPAEQLLRETKDDSVILVDVAGGTGYDIESLRKFFDRDIGAGRLVLQDLPQVVAEAGDVHPAIKKMPYDFFTEQPVKGATAYYMHSILHDWPTEKCLAILAQIKAAMTPGHSRLLINENVLTADSPPLTCAMDLTMMTVNAGAERTEAQWRDLLTTAGFHVVKVWASLIASDSLIEAEVPGP